MRRRRLIRLSAAAAAAAAVGALIGSQQRSLVPNSAASPSRSPGNAGVVRHFLRLDPAVKEFDAPGGAPVWSPDGTMLAVETASRSGHVVTVVQSVAWTSAFATDGSRPAWSPDGRSLALVTPFSPTVPPDPGTTIHILDAKTGSPQLTRNIAAFGLGWTGSTLCGVVGGSLRAIEDPRATVAVGCPDGCATAEWHAAGELVLLSGNAAPYPLALHDLAKSPSLVFDLGAVDALAWAPSARALAWSQGADVHVWMQERGNVQPRSLAGLRPVMWSARAELLLCRHDKTGVWSQWLREADGIDSAALPNEIAGGGPMFWSPANDYVAAIVPGSPFGTLRIYPVILD